MVKKQFYIFLAALQFYTKIPIRLSEENWRKHSAHSIRYFSFIGWITGGTAAFVYIGSSYIFPELISLIMSTLATIILTGALHEDGLSDCFDAFGGGMNKEQILEILKDSHTGVYGLLSLTFMLVLKVLFLSQFDSVLIPWVLLTGHSLSRAAVAPVTYFLEYCGSVTKSKSSHMVGSPVIFDVIIAMILGIVPVFFLDFWMFGFALFSILIPTLLLGLYFSRKIGGYRGDCLGAIQQISELSFYITIYLICNFM